MLTNSFTVLFFIFLLLPGLSCFQALAGNTPESPAYFGVALDGYPITKKRLENIKEDTGVSPGFVVFFLQWPPAEEPEDGVFPLESLEAIWNSGAVPCMTWEPMYYRDGQEIAVLEAEIIGGRYDSYLLSFAQQAKAWTRPFIIRFAHEMNIERYHWGTGKETFGPESPEVYKRIYRYIVDLFNEAGADNVSWAFCPNAESVPSPVHDPAASWNRAANYYPGGAYVDILGMDGYNWGLTFTKGKDGWDSRWKSFREIFDQIRHELMELAPKKPLIVFETSSVDRGGDRRLWISKAFETVQDWHLNGLIWFQTEKEQDWRLGREDLSVPEAASFLKTGGPDPRQWIKGKLKWNGKN